jgi:undecaprenyl-diphosphatase
MRDEQRKPAVYVADRRRTSEPAIGTVLREPVCWALSACLLLVTTEVLADPLPAPTPEQTPPPRVRFSADPITDGAIVSLSLGFGALSELVLNTGEIVPQQPQSTSRLLWIDRLALTKHEDGAAVLSSVGAGVALAYAVVDPIASGYRDGFETGLVDLILYAEALSLTWAATNIAKLTVRRPRPRAYQEQQRLYELYGMDNAPSITETDTGLSFFSGHTAIVAAVSSTATYLAFSRSPGTLRPWITLFAGVFLTGFVDVERVRAGAHFPTDVIAAAMAGMGIGLLVPHLHRVAPPTQRSVWIGLRSRDHGGVLELSGSL